MLIILRHSTGLNSKPTILSSHAPRLLRVHGFMSTVRGFVHRSLNGRLCNFETRYVWWSQDQGQALRINASLMASPSRSSSVANHTSSDFLVGLSQIHSPAFLYQKEPCNGQVIIVDINAHVILFKITYMSVATLNGKVSAQYFSIVFAFAGDSTINKFLPCLFFCIVMF